MSLVGEDPKHEQAPQPESAAPEDMSGPRQDYERSIYAKCDAEDRAAPSEKLQLQPENVDACIRDIAKNGVDSEGATTLRYACRVLNKAVALLPSATQRVPEDALRYAREFVADPDKRAQVKVQLCANGWEKLADLIDEAVIVSRALLALSSTGAGKGQGLPDYPLSLVPGCRWPECDCKGRWECSAALDGGAKREGKDG